MRRKQGRKWFRASAATSHRIMQSWPVRAIKQNNDRAIAEYSDRQVLTENADTDGVEHRQV